MRCPQCHAVNRPEAPACFRCRHPFSSPAPGTSDTPAWLWQEKAGLLEGLRRPPARWSPRRTWARRVVATTLDHLLLTSLFGLVVAAAGIATDFPLWTEWRRPTLQAQLGLIFLLLHFLYTFVFQVFLSATPGYWMMGLAVVPTLGPTPWLSPGRVTARWLGLWVFTALGGLDLWWSLGDREHRFLHDRLAGTRPVSYEEYSLSIDLLLRE